MTHKSLRALLVAFAFILVFVETGVAQMDMQQRIASAGGATANRSRPDAQGAMRNSGLAMVPADFALLKLAPGFLLSLNVLDDSDFVGTFRVDEQGDIFLPVLGSLHVAGETVSEARGQIRRMLLDGRILKDPQVDLSIQEYTAPQVTIIG
jgi:protein involved in polysaccharide export with SLBB domain